MGHFIMKYLAFVTHARSSIFAAILLFFLSAPACASAQQVVDGCKAEAVVTDGHRRLALVVGVGTFKNPSIPKLNGPAKDAKRFYQLLTGKNGYGFPEQNVCMLINEEATVDQFEKMFDQALVKRVQDEKDIVVVYFSSHGSITLDLNGDERGGKYDQTLLFYDSRVDGKYDLVDDVFNRMLVHLNRKTQNIVVFLDSCNSGTAVKGDAILTPKYFDELKLPPGVKLAGEMDSGEGSDGYMPKDVPGLVLFSAAGDGTAAMDGVDGSIFTNALLEVLSPVSNKPLTYEQASYEVRRKVVARSPQIPYFHGDISKVVFGSEKRHQPYSLRVVELDPLTLKGPALPGLGSNAELKVYERNATGGDTADPSQAKATLVVETTDSITTKARIRGPNSKDIKVGDIAVLVRPADKFMRLKVRPWAASDPEGVSPERVRAIKSAIGDNAEISSIIEIVPSNAAAQFELRTAPDGRLELRDKQNRIRNVYKQGVKEPGLIARNLWQHARQAALLDLRGEGGNLFQDNTTLRVSLEPLADTKQDRCASGEWEQSPPNTRQVIPVCYRYRVKVQLSADAPMPLLVGGAVMFSDGGIYGLRTPLQEPLAPGRSLTFDNTFRALPPFEIPDNVVIFGTQVNNPIEWDQLTSPVEEGAKAKGAVGSLQRTLERYFRVGTKGGVDETIHDDTPWTLSNIEVVVRANNRFLEPDKNDRGRPNKKEYSIQNFSILQYLPPDSESALYKALRKADWLAYHSMIDGIQYKQHAWNESTDEANLKKGIDCSRAIWFAFTRAGLPYNEDNKFLTTANMARLDSPMTKYFKRCDNDEYQIGDVLVYRDEKQGDGHVVMVIDPQLQIAWGSQGWDGNAKEGLQPDTGVEYQKIKYKPDWERWDRKTMEFKACWRYEQIAQELKTFSDRLGFRALGEVCNVYQDCGRLY